LWDANGGTIFIGKDNNEKTVGVDDAKKLLEEISNKVRDIFGILVDVNLHETKQGDYLEIVVEPYPNGISYKGQYHYRSGSTKQELKGIALEKFPLRNTCNRLD
jgi:ATP-dependent DNA helicase RecG